MTLGLLSWNPITGELHGAQWRDVERFYPGLDRLRQIERASIRAFMERHRGLLEGRVLDFGAGQQPYRDLVKGEYVPLEEGSLWPQGPFDAVMCNQVAQYLSDFAGDLARLAALLRPGGSLLMTYPTTWPEVETNDLTRYTKCGMERRIAEVGLNVVEHWMRAEILIPMNRLILGYGLVASK